MKQKISWFTLQCPNNVHTSRSKLCMAIQFVSFTLCCKRFVEMQHWAEVLFNGGINVLEKGEGAQKTTNILAPRRAINNTSIAVVNCSTKVGV